MTNRKETLMEASQVDALFSDEFIRLLDELEVMKHFQQHEPKLYIKNHLKEAKQILRKQDRVIWFAKHLKYFLMNRLYVQTKRSIYKEYRDEVFDFIEKEAKKWNEKNNQPKFKFNKTQAYEQEDVYDPRDILEALEHYYSLGIPEIDDVQLLKQSPKDIFDEFEEVEQEARLNMEEEGRFIPDRDDGSEIFLKIEPDLMWINLKKPYCEEEGRAMGHCGNRPRQYSGDTILSLRELHRRMGEDWWKPVATFILNSDGYLTEMKGFGNQKPSEQYHDAIVELLLDNRIEGIKGGGYLPENNFNLFDLGNEEAFELIGEKPSLASLYDYVVFIGDVDEVVMKTIAREHGDDAVDTDYNLFRIYQFDDMGEFIYRFGDIDIKQAYDIAVGEDYPIAAEKVYKDDLESALAGENEQVIKEYLEANYPDMYREYAYDWITVFGIIHPDMYDELEEAFIETAIGSYREYIKNHLNEFLYDRLHWNGEEYDEFRENVDVDFKWAEADDETDILAATNIEGFATEWLIHATIIYRQKANAEDLDYDIQDDVEHLVKRVLSDYMRPEYSLEKYFNFDEFRGKGHSILLGLRA